MESKEIILEARKMSWEENCEFEAYMEGTEKDLKTYMRKAAKWVIENVYKIDLSLLTPAEIYAVYMRTMELTNSIRNEELKNLKPSPSGSTGEEVTAQAAENLA